MLNAGTERIEDEVDTHGRSSSISTKNMASLNDDFAGPFIQHSQNQFPDQFQQPASPLKQSQSPETSYSPNGENKVGATAGGTGKGFSGVHLSELSVQLRKLQLQNNSQSSEIDRLKRQIRILSELREVSIEQLQQALKDACEREAHGELRAVVGKLKAEVEELEAGKFHQRNGNKRNFGRKAISLEPKDDDESHQFDVPTQAQFEQESASRTSAVLELRVGELEELEQTLRSEIENLFRHSEKLTERNSFLETQNLQQKAKLEGYERQWKLLQEEEVKNRRIVPATPVGPSYGSYNYAEFSASPNNYQNKPPPPLLLLHNKPQDQIDQDNQQRILAAETALAGSVHQKNLLEIQFDSAKKSWQLREDQFKCRLQMQSGLIFDLEQQLSSLYAAFGIVQNERMKEKGEKEGWRKFLEESDSKVAQDAYQKEQDGLNNSGKDNMNHSARAQVNNYQRCERASAPPNIDASMVKPAVHSPIVKGYLLLLLGGSSTSSTRSTASDNSFSFSPRKLLKSKTLKYKRQYCIIHGANGLYQLRYGDGYLSPVAGVLEFITAGVSTIEHTNRSSAKKHGFEIVVNEKDSSAPRLCCAAENDEDFVMWLTALMEIITFTEDDRKATAVTP